ncbi:MAG: AI-2E family transporter [Thermodesulfobacteriota bacterium]|nr:AI-2E family transporter [Thermodesulfobacteriota bacterium]
MEKNNLTPREHINLANYFLFALIFASLIICYKMMENYLNPVILAFIIAGMVNPLYRWTEKKCRGRKNIAASIMCFILIFVIMVPMLLIMSALVKQGIESFQAINQWVAAGNIEKISDFPIFSKLSDLAEQYLPAAVLEADILKEFDLYALVKDFSAKSGNFLIQQGGNILGSVTSVVIDFFLMVFVFFFVVQNQQVLFDYLSHLAPLSAKQEEILIERIKDIAKSALLGTLITAAAQGFAGGIAFVICGLPGFFWGVIMAFASLVPMVGTALVWLPASLYLFASGAWKSGIFLIVWSVVVVGMIDNFIRPLFMQGSAGMSTILIFFSILGGLSLFGLTGLLYGPLIFGITMVLFYIYELEFRSFLNDQDRMES